MDVELPIVIRRQPDYTTCGPTSLHAATRRRRSAGSAIAPSSQPSPVAATEDPRIHARGA
jgi:hypothetical protein